MTDDLISPFEVEPIPKSGPVGRLFRRVPRQAAFVAVRNILATTPFESVRESDVAVALGSAKLLCREATLELSSIFEHAALWLAADHELSDLDRQRLANLQRAFELTDEEAAAALHSAVNVIFERALREALVDGEFTQKEKDSLESAAKALGIGDDQLREIYRTVASETLRSRLVAALSDERYTAEEEEHAARLSNALGVTVVLEGTTAARVARARLMANIEAGNVPTLDVPVLLRRGEVCHFSGRASHKEIKTLTRRINYSGPTASFKITKGLRWRMGSIAVERVTHDVMTQVDDGAIYVTGNRILFDGTKKNTTILLGRITNFTVYKDGLRIEKDSGKDAYFIGALDWEMAGACLDAALARR